MAKDCRIDSTPVVLGRVGQAARKAEGNQPEKPEMPEIYAHLSAGGHIHLQTQGGLAHIDQATKQAQTVGILLNRGRLCGGEAVHLQSETDMSLGALDTSTLLGASKPSAIYTKGPLTCDTPWHMQWHQLEVRAEALQVHAGYGYELALMSPGTILKKEILYLEKQGSSLQYTVLNGADLVTVGVISTTELPSLEGRLTSPLNLEILKPLLFDMVKILSDRDQIPVAFDNVSSRVIIKGNADLDVPLSKHRLLVEEKANGHRYACGGGSQDCHEIYRIAGPSKRALSAGAHWVVGGCLSTSGHTKLLGSQIQCASFKPGSTVPEKTTVVPFTSYTESELCGHRKRDKAQWHHSSLQMRPESPLEATYSVAGVLEAQSSTLKIEGFLSALAIDISGIKEGWIGHRLDLQLRLPSSKPFKPCLQLMDYFKPTACFEMQSGGDTVYQSLLSNRMPELRLDPIIVMNPDGTLSRSEPGIRFLLTLEQEEELLGTAFMEELKRGYLDADLREPTRVLSALKQGAARRMVEEDNNTQALALRRADATSIQEPLLCYYKAPLHDEQGVFVEEVYLPAMGLPKRFDNPRLRDGAGGLFGLGPVTLGGVDGSVLTITANIDAQGVVTFRHLNQVNHVRRTVTELQAITQEIRTSRLARSDKVSTRTEFVPVTHLEPGNEIVTSVDGGVVYDEVDTVFMSGLRTDVGEQGYTIRGAKQVVDAAIVRNVIGSTQTDRQRGLLGMGGSMTTYQPVTQQAIGSQIHSMGPVYIETELGIFEATNFGQSPATLQVRELHYHELLRAMEARDRDVAKQIREAKKTRKRKQRQGTMWFLISLPVSAYVGGLVSGWLQSAMGVTIKATVVNGVRVAATASFAQTVAIVGTAGAVSGGVAAAIQKQSILKGALNAAPFAIAGNLVANSPALANSGFMVQTLAQTAAASGLHAFLHGHLSLENLVVAFGAAVVAESVVPSSDNDSIGREVFRAATSTTVMALLGNGTIQSLATSLMAAGVGASAGRMAAQQGEQHGTVLHQHRVFKQELIRVSEHASQALAAQGIHVPAKQIKKQLQRHPALQGSPEEVQARLIRRGTIEEGDSIQTGAAASLARGVAWVLGATLDAIIPVAYASEFTPEERSRGYGYQDEHALQKIEYSLPPRVAPNTVLSGTEWLKEFGISASESAIAIKVITMMAQNPKLLRLVKVAGWVSAGMLVAEGMQLDAQFGRDHFDLTGDFDRIMRNPGISEARKQEMRSQSRQNLARLEGGKAKSLSQVIKDNPRPLGLVFGGMLGVKLKFPTISTPEPFPEVALVGNARSLTPSYQAHRARHSVTVPMSSMERDFYSKSELVGVFNYEHRGKLPHDIATTFMGDRYSTYQLKEDYLFYRSGAAERELGQFFSFEKPASVIQTRIDNALPLFWSDGKPCVINTAYTIKVPKGTIVHVGESTQQGGVFLGGTPQIVIEDPRLIDGLKVVEKFSLEEYQKYGKK
ncbi:MAG: hypothetical protein KA508_06705 [Gammaproteobacteria bacterium]|nr:hypothetical protein [Gammaproteobacteria bacterium]